MLDRPGVDPVRSRKGMLGVYEGCRQFPCGLPTRSDGGFKLEHLYF